MVDPKNSELTLEGSTVQLRKMTGDDKGALLNFARELPSHDLLFLMRDITNEKVVDAWIRDLQSGSIQTLLALEGDAIVGCAAVISDPLSWSEHVGDIRVLVSASHRKQGLGRGLIEEAFQIAVDQGLSKLMARMTVDQKGAIAIFEELGFRGEALLKDHIKDGSGTLHDLVILSCDPSRYVQMRSAFAGSDE